MKHFVTLLLSFFLLTCSDALKRILTKKDIDKMIGMTFKEVLVKNDLDESTFSTIMEPPGIFRGIEGRLQDGNPVSLYVSRENAIKTLLI
ncbi:MAG: hypothetical protein IEMM0008_0453 [bacterium]|nr:MAG: hypothetical protein IEMM0008_0453 [bacterium]